MWLHIKHLYFMRHIRFQCSFKRLLINAIVLLFVTCIFTSPCFCQFADLPQDAKTLDIGFSGDDALQTLTLTCVIPLKNINGWTGVFGSRGSGNEGVITEIAKGRTREAFVLRRLVLRCLPILNETFQKEQP